MTGNTKKKKKSPSLFKKLFFFFGYLLGKQDYGITHRLELKYVRIRHGTAQADINLQQFLLPTQDLHKVKPVKSLA